MGRTLSSRGVEVIQSLNERTGPGSRPHLPRTHRRVARRVGTAAQNRGIMLDLVKELRSQGVRVDYPLDLGDFAPSP